MGDGWPRIRPPRLRIGDERRRHATWLELFFDLVFVVTVAALAARLGDDVSPEGAAGFVFLYGPVWWAWVGATFYANRFDTDDVEYRLLTAAEMFAVVALAVNVHAGFGASSSAFALGYATIRGLLVVKYLRAHRHVPEARPLTTRYAAGFGIDAALWAVSVLVPPPYRFGLWIAGLTVSVLTPVSAGRLHLDLAPNREHLPERFGLFTIIVLGESFVGVVSGVAGQGWTIRASTVAAFGVATAFSLWWIYFEHADDRAIRAALRVENPWVYQAWLYVHFPLVVSLTALGVGVEHVLRSSAGTPVPAADRWLVCGALALTFASLIALHLASERFDEGTHGLPMRTLAAGAIALLLVAELGSGTTPEALMGIVAAVSVVQIVAEEWVEEGRRPSDPTALDRAGGERDEP